MFSGIIAYTGTVEAISQLPAGGVQLRVRCEGVGSERPEPKDSIAINGVCLTATAISGDSVDFDVVPETVTRSTLGSLREGETVNVEYSLRLGDRMGGHFIYGHVDANARVIGRTPEGQGVRLRIERPRSLERMLVEKAFVAIDGVSLTIANTLDESNAFEIALIPETLARTTLGARAVGDGVNIEADPIARYVQAHMPA